MSCFPILGPSPKMEMYSVNYTFLKMGRNGEKNKNTSISLPSKNSLMMKIFNQKKNM